MTSRRTLLGVVFATILIDFVGFSVLIPVLPLFASRLGATPVQVGLILAIYALTQLLFLPFWGWIS
ncbi:MAG: MFS transporter, partial [bacterium]|nr:MFS transporter [bacterium]